MLSTTEFISALEQSNLFTADLIARIRKRVAESRGTVDPRSIAKYLIDKGHLSLWQANQLLAGRRAFFLGRYKLIERIGKGGMGVVFKARHAVMDRDVALKVMSRALLNNPQAVARFNREVKTAAALNHPNIITAYDADCVGSTHFLVMEYVDGRDLNAWLKARGPLPVAAACECARQAALGLAYAHRQRMVHRDIKPVNLLVTWNQESRRPVVKILDLGLARFVSETKEEGGLTRLGQTIGTPDYIAPEAAESFKDADIRADIFSLGCSLFKLLTGKLPFAGDNTMEKLLARTNSDAPPLRKLRSDLSAELEAVVAKMLARNPANRYQSPDEVVEALAPFAASTTGDMAALEFFSQPLADKGSPKTSDIHADADTSLAEFFLDFSVSPVREEKPPPVRPPAADDALELAPLDDEPPAARPRPHPAPSVTAPKPERMAAEKSTRPAAPSAGEPLPEVDAPAVDLDAADPIDELLEPPRGQHGRRAAKLARSVSPKPPLPTSKARRNAWDSPLLLAGGGALLLLTILAAALFWSVNRRSGDDMYKLASDAYRGGSYTQAVRDYDAFLQKFPDHKLAPTARVFRGLAVMRQAASGANQGPQALATTRQALSRISGEAKFGEARAELASILPSLAEGLARQAQRNKDVRLLEQSRQALELVNKYVPQDLRPGQRIGEIEHSLENTAREIARADALSKTLAAMKSAATAGDTAAAYAARKSLLKTYPDLESDDALRQAVLQIAAAEQSAVKRQQPNRPAETSEIQSPIQGSATLASRQGKNAPGVDGQLLSTLAAGSIYTIDAATGNLLWRRHVGAQAATPAVPVSAEPGADLLLVDATRNELCRVEGRSGNLRWRQALGDAAVGRPLVAGDRVWTATRSGKLVAVTLDDGQCALEVQLPQKLTTGPSIDASAQRLYQVAEHSSLFVLSPSTGQCEQVYYLGHEAGTITATPLSVSRFVFVAENHLLDNARLRVLITDAEGKLTEAQPLALDGHVHVPPQLVDRALYVVTDRGAIYAYEIGSADRQNPLVSQATAPATSAEHLVRLFVARAAQLWVASNQLNRYDIQLARGRLNAAAERYQGDVFQEPLSAQGDVLFHARRRQGTEAVVVAAADLRTGDPYWETQLAAPTAAILPDRDAGSVSVINSAGELFQVPLDALATRQPQNQPRLRPEGARWLGDDARVLPLSESMTAVCSRGPPPAALLIGSDQQGPKSLAWFTQDGLAAAPVPFAGAVVAPTLGGAVRLIDPATARPAAQAFEPPRQPAARFAWYDPVAYQGQQLLLADAAAQIYLLSIEDKPIRHLLASAERTLASRLEAPPAIAGDTAYLLCDTNQVVPVSLPDLKPGDPFALPAPIAWGPIREGDTVYLATSDGKLIALAGDRHPRWQADLPATAGSTRLVHVDGTLFLTSSDGTIVRLDASTGQQRAKVDVGEPLSGKPLVVGDRLLVGSAGGGLLSIVTAR
jgi:serine/threonine protein kinase/outer membrane protein assembly factor BamB